MEEHHFAALLREAGTPTTRRAALAAILGSGLALNLPDASQATEKAKRRKARRKRQARNATATSLRPIKFRVVNPGPNSVTIDYGDYYPLRCCHIMQSLTLGVGESEPLGTTNHTGFLWVAGRYWIDVFNRPILTPWVSVAVDGQPAENPQSCCLPPPAGINAVTDRPMSAGDLTSFSLGGHSFWVKREKDTNYLVFSVILPATLGPPPA